MRLSGLNCKLRQENLPNELVVGESSFSARTKRVDVHLVEVSVPQVSVARNDCAQHLLGICLPEDLQGGRRVDRGLTHREEVPKQPEIRIEVLTHLVQRLA